MTKKKIICLLIVVSLFVSGCTDASVKYLVFTKGDINEIEDEVPEWVKQGEIVEEATKDVDIHFVIDAGIPMKGFLYRAGSNFDRYISDFPGMSNRIFNKDDNNSHNITFSSYRLYDKVYSLCDPEKEYIHIGEEYNEYIDTVHFFTNYYYNEPPYTSKEECCLTRTDYVEFVEFASSIIEEDTGVAILVSDLIPDNKKFDPTLYDFYSALNEKILCKGYTIGVWGMLSAYDGTIKGAATEGVPYTGDLPFYFIVLGQDENVLSIINEFQKYAEDLAIDQSQYNSFIISDLLPVNTGNGNVFAMNWSSDCLKYIHEIDNNNTVSQSVINSQFFNQTKSYNLFPINVYDEAKHVFSGNIEYVIPYEIPTTSMTKLYDWEITISTESIKGELAANDSMMTELHDTKTEGLVFADDMRLDEYIYVYGTQEVEVDTKKDIAKQLMAQWDLRKDEFYESFQLPVVNKGTSCITFGEPTLDGNVINIPYSVEMNELDSNVPYVFTVNIEAQPRTGYRNYWSWLEGWTVEVKDAVDENEEKELEYIGAKTPNLEALGSFRGSRLDIDAFAAQQVYILVRGAEFTPEQDLEVLNQEVADLVEKQEQEQAMVEKDMKNNN